MCTMAPDTLAQAWLLLIFQLPAKPPYLRTKTWRRLQALGAVTLKGSVYALPNTDESQEDLQWLLKEIVDGGGEGLITEARLTGGLTDGDVESLFQEARSADYRELLTDIEAIAAPDKVEDPAVTLGQLSRARRRFNQIAAIDFFQAHGRDAVQRRLSNLEQQLAAGAQVEPEAASTLEVFRGRTWVTRKGVHVDRIACAWLIRRFIDPDATFKFVPPKGYRPASGELRFDMFEAEFTHEGDRCSFETFLARREIDDPGLRAIGEIIHDLDIRDDKFRRPETNGIGRMLDAIAMAHASDEVRIQRGSAMLDDLHAMFSSLEA
jgi:hypothetical protein